MGRCYGCGNWYTKLTTHERSCKKLRERDTRAWNVYQTVEADPVLRQRRNEHLGIGERSIFRMSQDEIEHEATLKRRREDELDVGMGYDAGIPDVERHLEDPVPPPPPPPEELPPKRKRRLAAKVREIVGDIMPEGPGVFEYINDDSDLDMVDEDTPNENFLIRIRRLLKTAMNSFSLSRTYHGIPSTIPDKNVEFTYLLSDHLRSQAIPVPRSQSFPIYRPILQIIAPYPNISAFLLNFWHWCTAKNTKSSRRALLRALFDKRFHRNDIRNVDFDRLDQKVVDYVNTPADSNAGEEDATRGWTCSSVRIDIPTGQKKTKATKKKKAAERRNRVPEDQDSSEDDEDASIRFHVPHFYHRSLVELITEVCSGKGSLDFHWHPYEENWQPPWEGAELERVHGELYTSSSFLEADRLLQQSPPEPSCYLPRVIAAIIIYSDATHLTQFGQAKLSPVYVFFGNQSKYERGVSKERAAYTVAFLPSLPDELADFFQSSTGRTPSAALLTHCRRELYHGCWRKLFDNRFLEAYEHGIPIDFGDQVRRRSYPRIFIKSMDYPEKVMAISIRDMGLYPCPRCLVFKDDIIFTGEPQDMATRHEKVRIDNEDHQKKIEKARKIIYNKGYVVNSDRVEEVLKAESLVPTPSAFSHPRLRACGLQMFDLMAVDLMHEVELGVWKALLQHLIRILHCQGSAAVQEFDKRFRQVAPFGKSTIRKFTYNVSDLRRLAARDYEDILQCCIPCIEGLLPPDENETVLDLVYLMAYFHSLAKLRMHTDSSVKVLREVIRVLCNSLRFFANETCKRFDTYETDREYNARRKKGKAGKDSKNKRTFSLATSKLHALPDYPDQIIRLGTTDSYSTKPGESNHRLMKQFYQRTNKNNAIPQIIKIDDLSWIHRRMKEELDAFYAAEVANSNANKPITKAEDLVQPYRIASTDKKKPIFLPDWLDEHRNDVAFGDFLPRLKAFILTHHHKLPFTKAPPEFTQEELSDIVIKNNTIFEHSTASFNFTTYDVRREQEGLNTNTRHQGDRTRCDVMLPNFADSHSDPRPFSYARVLGIFHLEAFLNHGKTALRIDFLWVRWFKPNEPYLPGPSSLRLEQVQPLPLDGPHALGFIHPSLVIRPCHLIPAFSHSRITSFSTPSVVEEERGDWKTYYVNRFADRDAMMRFLGLGVGHRNAADFPRESTVLRQIPSGSHYKTLPANVPPSTQEESQDMEENESEVDEVDEWLQTQVGAEETGDEQVATRSDFYSF